MLRAQIVIGYWEDDRYSAKPRPYWTNVFEYVEGKRSARQNQPTHWMPLPEAPTTQDK